MAAFDSGFRMGMSAFQQALDNKRQEQLDARSKEEFDWKKSDRARLDEGRNREDAAWNALGTGAQRPNDTPQQPPAVNEALQQGQAPVVDPLQGFAGVGAATVEAKPVASTLSGYPGIGGNATGAAEVPTTSASSGGIGLSAALSSQGRGGPAQGGVTAASKADGYRNLMNLAIARRDAAGVERLGGQLRTAEDDDFVAKSLKSYTGSDDQIGAAAMYLNNSHAKITLGDVGKNGMLPISVVKPDGRAVFLELPRHQQAQLYAAGALMERDPNRALQMISGVNKELGAAFDAESKLTLDVAKNQNDAAYKGGTLDLKRQEAAADQTYKNGMLAVQRQRVAAASAGSTSSAFDPMAGFDEKQTYKAALDMVGKQTEGPMAQKLSPQEHAKKVQEVYANLRDAYGDESTSRQRTGAFIAEARKAKSPGEIEAIRNAARERGYSDDEMARLDPRFAAQKTSAASPSANPPPAKQAPVPTRQAPVAQAPDPVVDSAAGRQLDAARQTVQQAQSELRAFGLKQRQQSPAGYEAALQRLDAAKANEKLAQNQWQEQIQRGALGAYFGGTPR